MAERDRSQRPSAEQHLAERQGRGGITFWEQVVAFVGVVIVAATLGYLAWRIAVESDGPPVLRVQAGVIQPNGSTHLVTFEVFNDGASTAAALEILGRLERDGAPVEESRATVDYLPPHSSRKGGLSFARDPAGFTLVLRSGGYADP